MSMNIKTDVSCDTDISVGVRIGITADVVRHS